MPTKKIVHSANMQDFRPIIWYGEPIFTRYNQIKNILNEKLGTKFANFLAEPVISKEVIENKGKAHWMSDYVINPQPFTSFPPDQQEQIRQNLQHTINKIKATAKELYDSDDKNQKALGELMGMAVEVPALEFVLVEDDKIILVLWGFTSEQAQKQNFQLSKVLEASVIPTPPLDNQQSEINQIQQNQDNQIDSKNVVLESKIESEKIIEQKVIQNSDSGKKKMPPWLWFVLGALLMFLILFLLWFFLLRDKERKYLPNEPGIIPPIDTSKAIHDPDDPVHRKVFNDRVNVALKKKTNIEAFAKKLIDKYPKGIEISYYDTMIYLVQVKTPEGEWKQWMTKLKEFEEVRLTFSESIFDHSEKPSDPGFGDNKMNWYFESIQAYDAWKVTQGSPEVVVAVIDNGFDLSHPEFKDKIVKPWNVVTRSKDLHPVGQQGSEHGTHVAGTAIGAANNNLGVCGIAPNCKLMPIQVADNNGAMSSLAIVAGVLYAIHQDADIVNMSLGMLFGPEVQQMPESEQKKMVQTLYPEEANFWDELFEFAGESKIVIIQAAGNQNILAGIDPFARSYKSLIVSALNTSGTKADFSNYGDLSLISAPGVEIYSSVPGGTFNYLQGTSMASPIVAGAAALIKSKNPDWTAQQIIDALVKTAIPVSSDKYVGPLLQLSKALNYTGSDSVMIIPENPKDISFAEGKWKSTTDLVSTIDKKKVELYFEIKKDGTGKLTLIEESGNKCIATTNVSWKNGQLEIIQNENAECDDNKYYYPYRFECKQGENNQAKCKAKQKDGSGDLIDFKMKKIE